MMKALSNKPFKVVALSDKNKESLINSASGGAFMALARPVIENGGVVFGCVLDSDGNCYHKSARTYEELKPMQGSKYVRSNVKNTYEECYKCLSENIKVLYSGTPCQIAGLNSYLEKKKLSAKNLKNLITVDVFCLGTPSAKLFNLYLKWLSEKHAHGNKIENLNFRSKVKGWGSNIMSYQYTHKSKTYKKYLYSWEDPYYNAFVHNKIMMQQCYKCKYKSKKRCSDFSIGDYWGIESAHPDFYQEHKNDGVSAVLVNTEKALRYFNEKVVDNVCYINSTYEKAKQQTIANDILNDYKENIEFNTKLDTSIQNGDYLEIFDSLLKAPKKKIVKKRIRILVSKIKRFTANTK